MAIIKNILLENGVAVNYHRIVSVNNITNVATIVEIGSYPDKSSRDLEKQKLKNGEPMNIYINTDYVNIPYGECLTVNDCYAVIKKLEKFENCKDDYDEK